jgi:hypothetical protein
MTTTTETVHLRSRYARGIACDITGPVRVTERLSEATCPRCQYEGDPVPRTRALQIEATHAAALTTAEFICPPEWGDIAGTVLIGDVVKTGKTYADVKWRESGRVERVRYRDARGVRFTA